MTAASTLRVGLDAAAAAAAIAAEAIAAEADIMGHSYGESPASQNPASTALFRRVERFELLHPPADRSKSTKRPRILDARLLEDHEDVKYYMEEQQQSNKKRRRLTLQLLGSGYEPPLQQRRSVIKYPILSPEQRAVDDSLQQVFEGTQSLRRHCSFIESAFEQKDSNLWPWAWRHSVSGNWLHAAAIWNESLVAAEHLNLLQQRFQLQRRQTLENILYGVDVDGKTPIQVAQMSGHDAVVEVLSSFAIANGSESNADDAYDFYCLVSDRHPDGEEQSEVENPDEVEHVVLNCQLQNGCMGYWDARGELVLLAPTAGENDSLHGDGNDDDDSNDEGYEGNDYPEDFDDGESNDAWSCSSNNSYGCQLDSDFRRRHGNNRVDNAENEDSADYDPSYGIYGHDEAGYDDEC